MQNPKWGGARTGSGRKPTDYRRHTISAYVTKKTKETLQEEATQKNTTVSRLIGDILEERQKKIL